MPATTSCGRWSRTRLQATGAARPPTGSRTIGVTCDAAASAGAPCAFCTGRVRRSPNCVIGHVSVARSDPDYLRLLVLNMVLGGQFVSRINMNLREDKGYTYGARTSFDARRGPGPFVLQASVQSDCDRRRDPRGGS